MLRQPHSIALGRWPAVWLVFTVAFNPGLAASARAAVEVQVPAPPRPAPVVAAHCRFLMPMEGGRSSFYRALDGRGRRIRQSAQWVDAAVGNLQAPITLSVEWRSDDRMFELPLGMVNFILRGEQENAYPLRVRFLRADGSAALVVEAGPGYDKPKQASAYVRVGELLAAIGDSPEVRIEVQRGPPEKAATTFSKDWTTTAFRAAVAGYPAGVRWLERAEASPGVFCTPT